MNRVIAVILPPKAKVGLSGDPVIGRSGDREERLKLRAKGQEPMANC